MKCQVALETLIIRNEVRLSYVKRHSDVIANIKVDFTSRQDTETHFIRPEPEVGFNEN